MTTAWVFNEFGGPEVLRQTYLGAKTDLAGSEVRIKTYACGINPIDAKIRNGSSFVAKKRVLEHVPHPWTLGFDLSGEIVRVGPDSVFKEGDIVCGCAGYVYDPCAYAQEVTCTDEYLVHVPEGVDLAQAAALPIAGVTALDMLPAIEKSGQKRVLLSGASGGVGHILTTLLSLRGFEVTALVSKGNFALASAQGAKECLDYHEDQASHYGKYGVVIDMLGGEIGKSLYNYIQKGGLFITVPTYSKNELIACARDYGVTATGTLAHVEKDKLRYLLELIKEGKLKIHISREFAFDDAINAHRQIESTHTAGKIILKA